MSKAKKLPKHLSESYLNQINVLKVMHQRDGVSRVKNLDINEIAAMSGVRDEKETQRYLYILEGHKLVSPFPVGDFTSKMWFITDEGVRAISSISSELSL